MGSRILWGVFIWKEFRGSSKSTNSLYTNVYSVCGRYYFNNLCGTIIPFMVTSEIGIVKKSGINQQNLK
jgi:hypothetical protein